MSRIVGVKLRKRSFPINADTGDLDVQENDKVVVDVDGVPTLGTVVPPIRYKCLIKQCSQNYIKILRKAEETDVRQEELNIRMERDYFQACLRKIKEQQLDMKLVDVSIEPDGSKVIFFFVAENRVDFRQLVKELASELRTRIEMRQIGARTEAQRLGGLGCCGRELCCSSFLRKFYPITVRMTKEQGLPLDPEKISGLCGRLMCCLSYEYDMYIECLEGLPKIGKKIMTQHGIGKIKQINVISRKISIELEDGIVVDLSIDDFHPDMLVPTDAKQ
ncbi:MAG: stage 0 sporulation protein [Desulfobacterota bacterium]|nr:stage 0 sporulation protein [Thermodesulfobacteriota bacterium]